MCDFVHIPMPVPVPPCVSPISVPPWASHVAAPASCCAVPAPRPAPLFASGAPQQLLPHMPRCAPATASSHAKGRKQLGMRFQAYPTVLKLEKVVANSVHICRCEAMSMWTHMMRRCRRRRRCGRRCGALAAAPAWPPAPDPAGARSRRDKTTTCLIRIRLMSFDDMTACRWRATSAPQEATATGEIQARADHTLATLPCPWAASLCAELRCQSCIVRLYWHK